MAARRAAGAAAAAARRNTASAVPGGGPASPPVLVVDGAWGAREVLEEAGRLSGGFAGPVELLSVGQAGIFTALGAAASLRVGDRAPAFALAGEESLPGLRCLVDRGPAGQKQRARGRSYSLSLAPAAQWVLLGDGDAAPDAGGEGGAPQRLLVGGQTGVQPLAKALAARAGALPEGGALALETALAGSERALRSRVARMAQAVALAHHWETFPREPLRPARPFLCAAALRIGEGGEAEALRIEVRPRGGPKRWGPGPGGGRAGGRAGESAGDRGEPPARPLPQACQERST